MNNALSLALAFKAMHDFLRREDVRDAVLALIRAGTLPWHGEYQGYWKHLEVYGWVQQGWGEDGQAVALLSPNLLEVLAKLAGVPSLGPAEVEERIRAEAEVLENLFYRTREVLASKRKADLPGALRDLEGVLRVQMRLKSLIESMKRSWRSEVEALAPIEGEDPQGEMERIKRLSDLGWSWTERTGKVLSVLQTLAQERMEEPLFEGVPGARQLWLLIQKNFLYLFVALQEVIHDVVTDLDYEGGLQNRLRRLELARRMTKVSLEFFQILDSKRVEVPPSLTAFPLAFLLSELDEETAFSLAKPLENFFAPLPEEEEEEGLLLPASEGSPEEELWSFLEDFAASPEKSLVRYVQKTDRWDLFAGALSTLYLHPQTLSALGGGALKFAIDSAHRPVPLLWDALKEESGEVLAKGGSREEVAGDLP